MKKNIVLIGSALSGNKGAAAMLESAIQTLGGRYEDVHFTLLSMYPIEDAQQNGYKNLTVLDASPLKLGVVINSLALFYRVIPPARNFILQNSKTIRALKTADVLLDQGGITFVDGREKFLIYNVASILPALMVGTPVVKCAQALGPFKNPINKAAANYFLPKMAAIVSRGSITHSYLETLKLSNVTAGADYAFSLELTKDEERSAKNKFKLPFKKSTKVVGVSPSVVMQKKVAASGGDYSKEIVDFIDYLTSKGYRVMLVPHSVRTGTDKTHNNDMPLCKEIFSALHNKEMCMFLDEELTSQELRYWIGQCDYFVASRFHAMVSSLAMSVPTLVIGWSHKYKEVLEMFELEEWAFGQDKLNHEYITSEFDRLVESDKDVRSKLQKNLKSVKTASAKQVKVIESVINKK